MMVKQIGDNISMSEYNGLVYLLRKFKKLVKHETISTLLETDIGTLNITDGFINVGENFILENDVNIISQNCLPFTTYSFTFYIINADTSEEIIETPVTVSGDTDQYGNLKITIPENLLSTGEEIRRDFKLEVTFQEHEGESPTHLNIDLNTDKKYIGANETATVTATIHDADDEPLTNYTVYFNINGTQISKTTNNQGEAILSLQGTENSGIINIKVLNEEINIINYYFYDHGIYSDHNSNYYSGDWTLLPLEEYTTLYCNSKDENYFCPSISPTRDIGERLEFDTPYSIEFDIYDTGKNVNLRVWNDDVVYFNHLIKDIGHYHLIIKEDIVELWIDNVLIQESVNITGNTSVSFVNVKTNDRYAYLVFANLIINNMDTIEPILDNYSLTLTGTSIMESGDEDVITATLLNNSVPVANKILNYVIKHDDTILDEGITNKTNSNGQATIKYIGNGVGDVDIIVTESDLGLEESFMIEDCWRYDLTKYTASQSGLNWDLPNRPFSLSFYIHRTNGNNNSGGYSYCTLRNSNYELLVGGTGSLSGKVMLGRSIGASSYVIQEGQVNYPNNTELRVEYIFNNGNHTVNLYDDDTLLVSGTTSNSNYNPTKVYSMDIGSANKIEKLKIKAL